MAKGVCQDEELEMPAGLSIELKSEIRGLQNQLASFAVTTMKLGEEIHNST